MDTRFIRKKFFQLLFPRKFYKNNPLMVPALARWAERKFFDGDDMIVLPRDKAIQVGQTLEKDSDVVLPSMVLKRFIEKAIARLSAKVDVT